MKIFLVGFMGSGKTTMGKKLANYLRYDFIDLDKFIESRSGMTINEYFAAHGEAAFRQMETEVIRETKYPENVVIATGGGAPCFNNNIDWMNDNGVVVYLSLSPKALANRLEHSTADRPLIHNLAGEDLVNFITGRLKDREPFYSRAKFVVSGTDLTAERLAFYLGLSSAGKLT